MLSAKKKHQLLLVIAILVATELVLRTLDGYIPGGFLVFKDFVTGVRITLIVFCIVVTGWSILKHQREMFFTVLWILLLLFGSVLNQIPQGHFETLGGLLSIQIANPKQVLHDSRVLIDEYQPMTCIGYNQQRFPCNNPIERDKLPDSIKKLHVGNVLILDNYVLIEKFGLQGVFRGFVVFREGADIWRNEKDVARQDGCNDCWKIRILDGIYWYHADPLDPPIFISPLK
jgi:hypothetical protein